MSRTERFSWQRTAILVTAGLSSPRDHALVSLLALNGLRVSEAIGANIEALRQERGHRTLTVLRKGGNLVTMPLAPRVARAIDLAVGERLGGPIFIDADGERLDRAQMRIRRSAPIVGTNADCAGRRRTEPCALATAHRTGRPNCGTESRARARSRPLLTAWACRRRAGFDWSAPFGVLCGR